MKLLFISNISGKYENNFSLSSLYAAEEFGIEFHRAANLNNKPEEVRQEEAQKYNIHFHHLDIKRNPFHPGNLKAFFQVMRLIKEEKFEAIHCNTPIGGMLGRICGKIAGVPRVIYTAHGFHFYKGAPLLNRTILKWSEQLMAHWTDAVITMNEEDYRAALKFRLRNNGKVYKVHGVGIDTAAYNAVSVDKEVLRRSVGLKADDIACISMGDLIPRKNYDTAIKAIAKCHNEKLHYLICGKGPCLENLQRLADELGVKNQIHFLGFRSDIKELLKASDIFLFSTLQEGLPRSMMEAMASGLPCVASKIRGNVDLIQDGINGFLCRPDSPDEFANAILSLTGSPETCKIMRENNAEIIKKYDISAVREQFKEIYKAEFKELD